MHRAVLGELVLERLPAGAHVLIMTHDHAEDFALCDAALRLADSDKSAAVGEYRADRVEREVGAVPKHSSPRPAIRREAIAMITSPIGLPELVGKEPAVIAVGVAAALLPHLQSGSPIVRTSTGAPPELCSKGSARI